MDLLISIIIFVGGFIFGALVIWLVKSNSTLSQEDYLNQMQDMFGSLSKEALTQNQTMFFELAKNQFENLIKSSEMTLEQKKKLIDSSLVEMKGKLDTLTAKTVELKGQIEESQKGVSKLSDTTGKLQQILSSSQKRGAWGERMVEDILNFIGLVNGINYSKQSQKEAGRPDYTFHLPMKKSVNMDVKFPIAHYEYYLDAKSDNERNSEKNQFLRDVREHIKTIAKKDYVNPAEGTVDYVLMFIPNESIYYFINQPLNFLFTRIHRKNRPAKFLINTHTLIPELFVII